jgi:hypothetical protein
MLNKNVEAGRNFSLAFGLMAITNETLQLSMWEQVDISKLRVAYLT